MCNTPVSRYSCCPCTSFALGLGRESNFTCDFSASQLYSCNEAQVSRFLCPFQCNEGSLCSNLYKTPTFCLDYWKRSTAHYITLKIGGPSLKLASITEQQQWLSDYSKQCISPVQCRSLWFEVNASCRVGQHIWLHYRVVRILPHSSQKKLKTIQLLKV